MSEIEQQTAKFSADFNRIRKEIGKVIVGNDQIVEGVLICLLANGHVLLEGVPGLGKTPPCANSLAGGRSEIFKSAVHP